LIARNIENEWISDTTLCFEYKTSTFKIGLVVEIHIVLSWMRGRPCGHAENFYCLWAELCDLMVLLNTAI